MTLVILMAAVVGYLLGSLPFGWIVARARGVDIFEVGSKSSGATNVRRVLGRAAGNTVFALDVLKGAVAAGWPLLPAFRDGRMPPAGPELPCVIGLAAALFGHSFSCFTRFKGGKGVATGAGGFLVLLPAETLIAAGVWTIAFLVTRYVSLASILAGLTIPIAAFLDGRPPVFTAAASVVAVFVIFRHRANLARLVKGTENKSGTK